jgi:uncharacterized protein YdcH (DUF465 family)
VDIPAKALIYIKAPLQIVDDNDPSNVKQVALMHIDNHPLAREFPEYQSLIHTLKTSDTHFARLFNEYEAADKAVIRAKEGVEHLGDLALEGLKKQRLALKEGHTHAINMRLAIR